MKLSCSRCAAGYRIDVARLRAPRVRVACLACGEILFLRRGDALPLPAGVVVGDGDGGATAAPSQEVPLWSEPAPTETAIQPSSPPPGEEGFVTEPAAEEEPTEAAILDALATQPSTAEADGAVRVESGARDEAPQEKGLEPLLDEQVADRPLMPFLEHPVVEKPLEPFLRTAADAAGAAGMDVEAPEAMEAARDFEPFLHPTREEPASASVLETPEQEDATALLTPGAVEEESAVAEPSVPFTEEERRFGPAEQERPFARRDLEEARDLAGGRDLAPPAPTQRPSGGFSFARVGDVSARAQRLARALVSDIRVYQPRKVEQGNRDANLKEILREEVEKSWDEYCERLGPDLARANRAYFVEALNDILAEGRLVF